MPHEQSTEDVEQAPAPEQPWAQPPEDVVGALDTSKEGLGEEEADRRRDRYGPNRLRRIERRSLWSILWDQVKSLIMLLLVVAMVVSFFFGQTVEAIAIAAVIVINTVIGFVTEWRAVRSMEALQKMGSVEATVVRSGEERQVAAEELVPGDVVRLREGDVIPADVRLINVDGLQVDESALTGESVPVDKQSEPVDADTPLADRVSMGYKGTAVTRGTATAVVVQTGMESEIGEISEMVEAAGQQLTPLEQKLNRLGHKLVWLTLAVAAAVGGAGILAGRDTYQMIETAIALAVAAVPEGLPIVATVALAYGMFKMLRRNALIRRLSSVETLGATTIICTDKTGTLTENRMHVVRMALPAGSVSVDTEHEGADAFTHEEETWDPEEHDALRAALRAAILCNSARLDGAEGDGEPQGDPMEIALLELGRRADRPRTELVERLPQVREVPFNRETAMMATYHEQDEGYLVAVKGAPEAVLDVCTQIRERDGVHELDDESRDAWEQRDDDLAAEGLRILALAEKSVSDRDAEPYEDLVFLGYVGLLDPPRTDVREVIEECRAAGIRVVVVTGDHPATARQVAGAVGLDVESGEIVEGRSFPELDEMSDEDRARIRRATVFARVNPKQKLDLIEIHQDAGEVVAMTGDGVNDAPALRSADIGVAMGQRGSDVAQEAADMVLQDDELSSIAAAVEQGRVIFSNIRRFVVYLLSGNVGQILAVGTAATVGTALPLLPLQILYLNMINDVFPALALGVGPGARHTMDRPPRDPSVPMISRYQWYLIGGYGVLIGATVFGAYMFALHGLGMDTTEAVTVSFLTISITRLLHVFNMRSASSGLVRNEVSRNPWVWVALGVSVALLLVAVYVPFLADILKVTAPGPQHWLVIVGASLIPLVVGQLFLAVRRRRADSQQTGAAGAPSNVRRNEGERERPVEREEKAEREEDVEREEETKREARAEGEEKSDKQPEAEGEGRGSDEASRAEVHESLARAHEERAEAHFERAEAHEERARAEAARLASQQQKDQYQNDEQR